MSTSNGRSNGIPTSPWSTGRQRPIRSRLTYDAIHLNPPVLRSTAPHRRGSPHSETQLDNGTVTRVHVADGCPERVAVNLTATGTRAAGWFTAYPCEAGRPDVSNLNHRRDHTVAAAAIVPVGPSGDICVYNQTVNALLVDLFGRFDDTVDLVDATPTRLHDSRILGERQPVSTEFDCMSPNRALARWR